MQRVVTTHCSREEDKIALSVLHNNGVNQQACREIGGRKRGRKEGGECKKRPKQKLQHFR
jgi:hypothetical protein